MKANPKIRSVPELLRRGTLLPGLFALLGATAPAGAQVIEDFDGEAALGARWAAAGKVEVARNAFPGDAGANGPSGNSMHVRSEGRFAVYTKVPTPPEADWERAETLAFWVYQEENRDTRIDVMALEPDRKAVFWRKCTFSGSGWQRIEMPLRWFRWEERRQPRWGQVAHFGIRGDGGLDFRMDRFELVDAAPDEGSRVSLEELTELAFPKAAEETFQVKADEDAWVLSDAPNLDIGKLHSHLVSVRRALERDIPAWKREPASEYRVPKLVVFGNEEAYRSFFERMGDRLLGSIVPPSSSGYHVLGIAVSYWDPKWGTLRPVFTHEFVHSFAACFGLQGSSGSDWFQEGVANLYQLRNHPQSGISGVIREGLEKEGFRSPLSELCRGDTISMNRYWQALSVVDFLIRDESVKDKFGALLARMEATGSIDLHEHLEPVYGMNFEELEERWIAFARANLDAYEPAP